MIKDLADIKQVSTIALDTNGTLLTRGLSTETTTGVFNFSFTLPSSAYVGTYSIRLDANYSGNEIHDILSFMVSSGIEYIRNQVDNISMYVEDINDTVTDYDIHCPVLKRKILDVAFPKLDILKAKLLSVLHS